MSTARVDISPSHAHCPPINQPKGAPANEPAKACIKCSKCIPPPPVSTAKTKDRKHRGKDPVKAVDRVPEAEKILEDMAVVVRRSVEEMESLTLRLEEMKKSADAMTRALGKLETSLRKDDG